MIYLIDNTIDGQGASPRELRAALDRVRPGIEILTEPFSAVSLERVRELTAVGAATTASEIVTAAPAEAATRILATLRAWGYLA